MEKGDDQQCDHQMAEGSKRKPIPVKGAADENTEKEYSHFNEKHNSQRVKHDASANSDTTAPVRTASRAEILHNIK